MLDAVRDILLTFYSKGRIYPALHGYIETLSRLPSGNKVPIILTEFC